MSLSLTVKAGIRGNHTNALDLGTADLPVDVQAAIALANGTGANQADLYWSDTRTIAASATDSIDLAGALGGAFGAAQVFARVKAIFVKAAAANANNVNVIQLMQDASI